MSKILIMDDDENIRSFVYDLLTDEGYEVKAVPSGDMAFAEVLKNKPDLLIMDIMVPGEEGLSLLRSLPTQKDYRPPVIVFSGSVTQEIEKEAFSLGATDVLHKNIEPQRLLNAVNKILKHAKPVMSDVSVPKPPKEEPEDSDKKKILVVDDEESIRDFIVEFFEQKGFDVRTAVSGEEALEMVQDVKPDMILMDVAMPGMDGIMTLKKIREIMPDVGVVMATGTQDEAIATEATRCGAYAYVIKPFDLKYLELVVMTRLVMSS